MRDRDLNKACVVMPFVIAAALGAGACRESRDMVNDIAVIRPETRTGFSNGGWNLDRYADLEPLTAGASITVADLKGPGIIRSIHSTRHAPAELFARGIVLEIWFDHGDRPAVFCPLADFFGDGCNGGSINFSSHLVECAPWGYNTYFPMPFQKRARVILRNDTHKDTANYSFVEWEPLVEWKPSYGYFHATYRRRFFQLTPKTSEVMLNLEGAGQVVGRQFSIVTDEPIFKDFGYVMEGNNEIDIDGRERVVDYLGSECSFGFCWGFIETFRGLRAGMTVIDKGQTQRLSVYRFHDHMPIRFAESLQWRINWSCERHFFDNPDWVKAHAEALARNGCWVDYATVHYWYQDAPSGYEHTPLRPIEHRTKPLLHSNRGPASTAPSGSAG